MKNCKLGTPPPPLVDLVALVTPKQNKYSKKWSVGVNATSTAIIFEYLTSARLSIQSDGRLYIPSQQGSLSSTHSSLSSQNTSIPRISHISVPRTVYFSNNLVRSRLMNVCNCFLNNSFDLIEWLRILRLEG